MRVEVEWPVDGAGNAFAFAVCVGPGVHYEAVCRPAIERFRRPQDALITVYESRSMFEAYDEIFTTAAGIAGCQGVLAFHDDVELRSDPIPELELLLEVENLGLAGALGGAAGTSLAWWREQPERRGWIADLRKVHDHGSGHHVVDVVDDVALFIPRATLETIRFRGSPYRGYEGLGVILSSYVHRAERRVVVAELDTFHHNDCIGFNNVVDWRWNELAWQVDFFDVGALERARSAVRALLAGTVPARIALTRALGAVLRREPPPGDGEAQDHAVDSLVERWFRDGTRLRGRSRPPFDGSSRRLEVGTSDVR